MDVVQNSQKFRVRVIPAGKYPPSGEDFFLKWRISSNLHMACSHWANAPEAIRSCVAIIDTTTETINREPQRMATGATAGLTATCRS